LVSSTRLQGNLTENEKREFDHFRRLAQQPGGKHALDLVELPAQGFLALLAQNIVGVGRFLPGCADLKSIKDQHRQRGDRNAPLPLRKEENDLMDLLFPGHKTMTAKQVKAALLESA
jgi:hypothetical protein